MAILSIVKNFLAPKFGQLEVNATCIHYIIIIVLLRRDLLQCIHVLHFVLRINKMIGSS